MLTSKTYISVNKDACANNCVCFLLWQERPFTTSLMDIEMHVSELRYCDPHAMAEAVKNVLRTMTTEEGVKTFIRRYKKTYVKPYYKGVQDFINGEYGIPGLTPNTLARIIKEEFSNI